MDNQYKGMGITAMILGIVSVLLCWTVIISGLCAVAGAAFGIYCLSKRKQERGFAIAGIATSVVGMVLSVFLVVMIFVASISVKNNIPSLEEQIPYYEEQPHDDFFEDYYDDFFYEDDTERQQDFF